MTLSLNKNFQLARVRTTEAPSTINPEELSIIIPVKNNYNGITRLIQQLVKYKENYLEIIIIDDGSSVPLTFDDFNFQPKNMLTIIRTRGIGPSGARNKGVTISKGNWILFIDSDCLITSNLFENYQKNIDGSVAYAGHVVAYDKNLLSSFYNSQLVLLPFQKEDDGPQYVVTSNALIWKDAFNEIGGFDQSFYFAGGEDVDLGFRLRQIGNLKYVREASVSHEFGGVVNFINRFFRYGRANALLEKKYLINFLPKKQKVNHNSFSIHIFSYLQYLSMFLGYFSEKYHFKNEYRKKEQHDKNNCLI